MSRINILDEKTANAIKAGEVIERPVSVVKELVDNSVDAGASSVRIEFENGGISLIRVSDNGIGMAEEDARRSFLNIRIQGRGPGFCGRLRGCFPDDSPE